MKLLGKMIRDKNDVNEKTIIGMISFLIMIIFAVIDLVTAYFGKELAIKEYIYTSFLILTLGSFGISSVDKFTNVRHGRRRSDDTEHKDYGDEMYDEYDDNTEDDDRSRYD